MIAPVRIPLRGKDGAIRAFALVDREDADSVMASQWSLKGSYVARNAASPTGRRTLFLHRFILGLRLGDGLEADHINRDPLDNRRSNLRVVTHGQNVQNQQAASGSASRFRNVTWDASRRRWDARITVGGEVRRLGRFVNELDAAIATQAARDEYMPFAQPDPALVDALAVLSLKDVAA